MLKYLKIKLFIFNTKVKVIKLIDSVSISLLQYEQFHIPIHTNFVASQGFVSK